MSGILKYSKEEQLEEESRLALKSLLPANYIVRDMRDRDKGLDIEIELAEGVDLTGKRVFVQLKSTENQPKKNVPSLSFKTKHLKYWEQCDLPVIIIYGIKKVEGNFNFYYLFIQEYIFSILPKQNPSWRKQKTLTIKFPEKLSEKKEQIEEIFSDISLNGYILIASRRLNMNNPNGAMYFVDGVPYSDNYKLKQLTAGVLELLNEENYLEAITNLEYILKKLTLSPIEKMSTFVTLGNAYYALKHFNKAEESYRMIITLKEKMNKKEPILEEAIAIGNLGLVFKERGKFDEAMKYLQDALVINQELNRKEGIASQLGNIGLLLQMQHKSDDALKYNQEALNIAKEIGWREGESLYLGNLGLTHLAKGNFEKAWKHLQVALSIEREFGNKGGEARQLGNLALILQEQEKLDEAIEYLNDTLGIYQKLGNEEGKAAILANLGIALHKQGQFEKALDYHQKALDIHQASGNEDGEAADLENLSLILFDQGKYEEAFEHIRTTLRIFTKLDFKIEKALTLMNLGFMYTKISEIKDREKNCKLAQRYLTKASEIAIQEENYELIDSIQACLEVLSFICFQ